MLLSSVNWSDRYCNYYTKIWDYISKIGVRVKIRAYEGCRSCTISKDSFTDFTQDMALTSRYHHLTDSEFSLISAETVIAQKKWLSREYGLKLRPSILDELKRERHLQTPQDIYHITAGKIGRLLKLTCELFSQKGENDFIKTWKDFEKPKT